MHSFATHTLEKIVLRRKPLMRRGLPDHPLDTYLQFEVAYWYARNQGTSMFHKGDLG